MIGNIQSLRFLAALWVALYHMRPPLAPHGFTLLPSAFTQMGFMGVDVFFVISGAIMAETTRHQGSGRRSALYFIAIRFSRIFTGWWPFFALYWVLYNASGTLRDDKNIVASFFLWPQYVHQYLLPIAWTLSFELYFYLGVAALLWWNRSKAKYALLAVALTIALINIYFVMQGYYIPHPSREVTLFQAFYASPLVLEFIAGFLLSDYLHSRQAPVTTPWVLGVLVFGIAGSCFKSFAPMQLGGMEGVFHAPERVLLLGGAATALVGLAMTLEMRRISPFPLLQRLGDISYSTYLSHIMIIAVAFHLRQRLDLDLIPDQVFALLVLTFIVLYSAMHYRWIEHPLYLASRKFWNKLWSGTMR